MFQKATKKHTKLRLALCGPSGSGKTMSALRIAKGMSSKIALIDTERASASLYADKFDFDVMELTPPYKPSAYIEAIQAAGQAGYELLVIDSLSHVWSGEGGILESVDAASQKSGNKFTAWGPATQAQNQLINAILGFPGHVIATMRSKQEYALQEQTNRNGKSVQVPVKMGMAPVQRDGVEYEFAIVLDVDMRHEASIGLAGKDRTGLFADQPPRVLSEDDGKAILNWINSVPAPAPEPSAADKREQLATAMIAALNEATTLEEIGAVAKLAPKGWFTVKDDHNKTVTDAAERRKLFVLADLIDAWADEGKLDAAQLEMLCNDLDINMKTMNSAQAQKLVDALKKLPVTA